jgi:hypothetical protein
MASTRLTVLSITTFLLLAGGPTAHAQLGGLIKKKVGDAVKSPDKSKEKAKAPDGEQGPKFNERVVELTEPVVKGLRKGLDLEIAQLTEFRQFLGTIKTEEQYDACTVDVARTPDAQKIMLQMTDLPDNTTSEQLQRIREKMNVDMNALLKKRCGVNLTEEWSDDKRQDKISEIHRSAATAAGLLLVAKSPGQLEESAADAAPAAGLAEGPAATEPFDPSAADIAGILSSRTPPWERDELVIDEPAMQSAQQQGSTEPLDVAEERITAYCKYKKVAAPGIFPLPNGYNLSFAASKIAPNGSSSIYWYYTAAEVAAIDPLCTDVILTIGKIEMIMDDIHIYGRRK